MKQILPGILRLQVVDCSLLPPNVSLKSKANLPISVLADTTEISFVGSPKCEYNIKNDNNSTSEKRYWNSLQTSIFRLMSRMLPLSYHVHPVNLI